jgi:GNAT superfamily N-acetyltransferase
MAKDSSFLIRPAVPADQTGVLHCLAVAFDPYRDDYTTPAFARTVLDPAGYIERLQAMHLLVAQSESRIAGTIAGACHGREGRLRGMAVLPEWRGTGLSAQLLATMEAWLKEQGCHRITLGTTPPLQAAIRFYERAGYSHTGKITDFHGMPLLDYAKELSITRL